MAERQRGKLFAMADEKRATTDNETACFQLHQLCEDFIEVAFAAGIQDMDLQPHGAGGRRNRARRGFRNSGLGRIDKERHDAGRWEQFVQQLKPLRRDLYIRLGHPGDIASRSTQAGDQTKLRRVTSGFEDDRNFCRGRLCGYRSGSTGRGDYRHPTMHQIGRQRGQPAGSVFRPTVFD